MVGPQQHPDFDSGARERASAPRRGRRPVLPLHATILALAVGLLTGAIAASCCAPSSRGQSLVSVPALVQALGLPAPEEKLVFSVASSEPPASPDLLPAGAPVVYLFYHVPNSGGVPKVSWSAARGRAVKVPAAAVTAGSPPGNGAVVLRAPAGGFQPGIYDVQLSFPGSRVSGSFVVAPAAEQVLSQPAPQDAQIAVAEAAFADGVDGGGKPTRIRSAFAGSERVTFVFHYRQAEPGSAVQVKWYAGSECLESATHEVVLPSAEGWASAWLQAPPPGLPVGTYKAAVNMASDPQEIVSREFTVDRPGAGASPKPPAARR